MIPRLPQGLGHVHRHTAIEHAHAALTVVIQLPIHHLQTAAAAVLHSRALHRHDLMGPVGAGIHPLHAVFLEKQRTSQIVRRPGELPVGATGGRIAVGGQSREAVPVFEVPQLAGIDGVHRLAVHDAVFAPPQPVAAFHHIVHVRHGPLHRHRLRLGRQPAGQRRHHQAVLLCGPQLEAAVQRLLPASADGYAVPGPEAHADPGGVKPHAHVVHLHPAVLAILPQGRFLPAGVQPQAAAFRLLRGGVRRQIPAVRGAVGPTQGEGYLPLGDALIFQAAEIRQVLGVDVQLVRPDQQPRTHADQLLLSLRQHQPRRAAVYIQGVPVHPDKPVLGGQAPGSGNASRYPPGAAHRQGGIPLGAQVLHLPEAALLPSGPPVQSREPIHRHPALPGCV